MTISQSHRILLRAAMSHRDAQTITHTVEISESLVFVLTEEEAFVGDTVTVEFSFPGLVEPFSIETQMIARRDGNLSGQLAGWLLGFVFYHEAERAWVKRLLRRMEAPPVLSSPSALAESGNRALVAGEAPGSYRMLLVDDNELTRQAVTYAARKLFGSHMSSITLDVVADSNDAWDALRRTRYDLVIIDYFLPVSSGDHLIAGLRKDPELAGLPIIAVSMGGAEVRAATLAAGADLFVPKPMVIRHLFHTLQWLLGPAYPDTSLQRSAV